jgi:hypothetical protein
MPIDLKQANVEHWQGEVATYEWMRDSYHVDGVPPVADDNAAYLNVLMFLRWARKKLAEAQSA